MKAEELANILQQEGIDVERLRSDFVSYGVVRTHITECLGAEYDPGEPDNWERDAISIANDHAREKIDDAVRSLVRKGEVDWLSTRQERVTGSISVYRCFYALCQH